jgi:hypothetical protein
MDTRQILTELRAERSRLDQAIAALETLSGVPAAPAAAPAKAAPAKSHHGGARHMSPAARKLISIRMKERWAERKKKAGNGRHMSAAARKLISKRMKQRWAERRAKG